MALRIFLPGFEELADDGPDRKEVRAVRRFRRAIRKERSFNIALLKIVDAKGSVLEHLTHITGMSVDSLKGRIKRARFDYDDVDNGPGYELDNDERRYLARRYGSSEDPSVQDFLSKNTSCTRLRPDWRGSHDVDARPVGKKRRSRRSA